MKVPVLIAAGGDGWEAKLVQSLDSDELGITVVRRCVDVADLIAVATTGTVRAAIVSGDLRRLDGHALARLAVARVAVVGLVPPDDSSAALRLQHLGVQHVLPGDSAPHAVVSAVLDAVAHRVDGTPARAGFDARTALPDHVPPDVDGRPTGAGTGQVIAIWGPTGAPGRTTLAVTLATELAALGVGTTLVDADLYGGAVAQTLGLLDEAPGLAAAVRLANAGTLDSAALAGFARSISANLRVLTGIVRADRWPELSPDAFGGVLDLLRHVSPVIVVDCGFCLEHDEELAYDAVGGRRNAVTLTALDEADVVLAVGGADPVSVQRLVRGLAEMSEVLPDVTPRVIVNRVRRGVTPGDPEQEIAAALTRYAGVTPVAFIPEDRRGVDAALAAGRSLGEVAPGSPVRAAVVTIARQLVGRPVRRSRARRLLTRR